MRAKKTTVMAAALALGATLLALAGPLAPARAQPAASQAPAPAAAAPKAVPEAAAKGSSPAPNAPASTSKAGAPATGAPAGTAQPAAPPAQGAPAATGAAPAAAAPENGAAAETPAPPPPPTDPVIVETREKMDAIRPALDSLEAGLSVEGLRAKDLDDLRARLDPLRRDLGAQADAVAPRLADIQRRLKELGDKPADGAPPENPTVTADRERLQALKNEFDAVLRQNRALAVRGDQISDRISSRRRALFTDQLFEQSESVINPTLWTNALTSLGSETRAISYLISDWGAYIAQRHSTPSVVGILTGALALIGAILLVGRYIRRRFTAPPPEDDKALPRRRAARDALKVAALDLITAPLAAVAAIALLRGFDMIPPRADDLVRGLIAAVVILSIGYGFAHGTLAPNEPWRRLLPMSDRTAQITFRYFSIGNWALAISAFLNALHKTLFAPVSLTVVTSAVMALVVGGSISRLLINIAREEPDAEEAPTPAPDAAAPAEEDATTPERGLNWLRFLVWLALAALVGALVAGYVGFAAFVAARLVVAAMVVSALFLFTTLVDVGLAEGLRANTPRAYRLSKTLGLQVNTIELMGILMAGLLKVALVLLAVLLIAGSWGTSTADVLDTVERMSFGVRIGNITVSLWNAVYAVILLLVSLLLAKGLQRWIAGTVLPRTGLEPSLQSSIATIVGYVGFIVAFMVSMNQLGLNLENIALVAGALSVGIGFGLQSIVSNFISGLILLAERPIRVGDTINVKGEEGYVRKISVRSTEIETFERATVIVPNSDLITGMVKNWTHTNTTGRVIVTVNVAFDCDAERVRDILVGCAYDNPQVLQTPPPRVFLSRFSDVGMAFELRCVVANVDYSLTVRSDLHFAILKRFREENIGFASQPWASMARAPTDMVPVPPQPPEPAPDADATPPFARIPPASQAS